MRACKKGHEISGARCRLCNAAYSRQWRKDNPEKHQLSLSQWRVANPDRCRAHRTKARLANPGKHAAHSASYQRRHPETNNAATKRWRESLPDAYIRARLLYPEAVTGGLIEATRAVIKLKRLIKEKQNENAKRY